MFYILHPRYIDVQILKVCGTVEYNTEKKYNHTINFLNQRAGIILPKCEKNLLTNFNGPRENALRVKLMCIAYQSTKDSRL